MARRVRDINLESRTARSGLKARGKPYWRTIEAGLHLGYRRLKGVAGRWVVRHYIGGTKGYDVETIATADDYSDADGVAVLNFWQAQTAARERMVKRAHAAVGKTGPLTVADAMDRYLEYLDTKKKSGRDARSRDRLYIRPVLGEIEITALDVDRLRRWLANLGKAGRSVRTKLGTTPKPRPILNNDDARRARQASANRTLTVLKAALNSVWRDGKVPSDAAWRRVEPFENVEAARARYLTVAEAKRLINGSDPDFRAIVQAALQTGARLGELAALQVHDFNPDKGTVAIRRSKSGKPRHVVLTDEGSRFFHSICAGRAGTEIMLQKAAGGAWLPSHQARPMVAACQRGKIKPPIGFHGLRHTWASLAIMEGVPLIVVAKNLGHSDTRMVERHYGHLTDSYVADAIRAGAPRFGFKPSTKLVSLREKA